MTIEAIRQVARRQNVRLFVAGIAASVLWGLGPGRPVLQAQGNPNNPVALENQKAGDTGWDISGAGDPTIQGFATDISVNTGQTVSFKIQTDSTNYQINIYRLGYYGGAGARKVATVLPTATLPQAQPPCLTDAVTGLVDCGKWGVSASWATTGAVSGIYVARLTRIDTGGASHIVFIVRDDTRLAAVMLQTSDTTWQAYNQYGGGSLYCGGPISNAGTAYTCATRSAKVSYNRPFDTRGHDPQSFVFNAEYPMVRWLEANGYDVKYVAGVDTDRRGADLTGTVKPKAFLSVGHDEYWSGNQRTTIENARNAGVNLAFFSGNEMFWKTRYEPSIDGSNTAYRTLVSYKETLASAKIDPALDGSGNPIWTGAWRDPRFSPPADGGRPENTVTGNMWTVNAGTTAITVPAAMAKLRFWQHTRVAQLTSGVATLSDGTLGYEWDEDLDNGARPTGLMHLSSTTVNGVEKIVDYGATVGGNETAIHTLTLYRHPSGALVFGAGTVQWSWGLDSSHDRGTSVPDQAIQQSTVNLLADMGAQAGTLRNGADGHPLLVPSPSTDVFAPTSVITSPAAGGQVQSGNPVTITGTATDNGGGVVTGVEVSADGGATWHLAQGAAAWSFVWIPGSLGAATIQSRAIDDSGNLEAAGAGVTVSVVAGTCPCTTIWKPSAVPTVLSTTDAAAVELGVKFKSDVDGFIKGIRFYKGPANSGTHQGSLWTLGGMRLAMAVFTTETATGWQQVNFTTPVHVTANTTYVASYHTNVGGYSIDGAYFQNASVDSPPLHALPSLTAGGNGVFSYGASVFPTHTFNNANYWVDVVFAQIADSTGPTISGINVQVIDGSTAAIAWQTSSAATSRIDYSTDPSLPPLPVGVTVTKTDGAFVTQHSMTVTGLTFNATYYFRITAIDQSANVLVTMAPSFTVPGPTLHDTASVDFLAGTSTNTYIAQTGDGEVILAPTTGSEFTGPTLPAGWIEVPWGPEGYSIMDNGVLLVDGARVASCATDTNGVCLPGETTTTTPSAIFTSPHSLEFAASFSGDQFQHAGFGQTLATGSEPWAMFSTLGGGQLYARTNPGSGSVDTALGPALLGSFHRFRIDWTAASVNYSVDGTLVASHALTVAGPMRPIGASDFNPFGGVVFVDWMRMTPYAAGGTFVSRVFDAQSPVDWHTLQWTANAPAGTSVAISVRTGSTPTPDGSWSAFVPKPAPGSLSVNSRYIQYQVVLTSSITNMTPDFDDLVISTGYAPVAVNDAGATNLNTSYTFPASGPNSLTFNDTDADTPLAQLHVVAVTSPAHGSATLNVTNGSVTYTPSPDFSGSDGFTYTVSDGLLTSTATVSMNVGPVTIDSSPVASNSAITTNEDTPAIGTLGASGAHALTYSLVANGTKGSATISNIATGAFTYAPNANANGTDTFTFKVNDGKADSNVATVTVTITAVNDAPSFTKGADQTVFANSGTHAVVGWATALSAGPPDEAAQTLSFIVSNTNNALFSAQPAISPNGTLTYTSAANAVGSATVTVAIHDTGGTANGGVDTGASQTFTIDVGQGTTVTSNFNGTPISAGDFIWFNSVLNVQGLGSNPVTIGFAGSASFTVNGTPYVVPVPSAIINFSPSVYVATTAFCNGQWVTTVPLSGLAGNVFLDGMVLQAPAPAGFPSGIHDVTWKGMFFSLTPGLKIQWQWGGAVYHNANFGADYKVLGVKPVDDNKASAYQNSDHAGTPENFRRYVVGGATGGGGSNFTGSYSGTGASIPTPGSLPAACSGS